MKGINKFSHKLKGLKIMKKTTKRLIACLVAAGMISSCGCSVLADYSENEGAINLDTMKVSGDGISVSDKIITITEGGDFTVTGTADDAMIQVNAKDKVKLRLSGMSLTNTDGPAIFFENAEKAFITITEDTENYLADGDEYSVDAKATLFSNDDLEIKGKGTLTITGNYKHGIASDDDIKIENGTINITANVKDGVHANDDIEITGGDITVSAIKQGFQAEENFIISNGSVTVIKSTEGIESGGSITIDGGEMDITASDDGLNSGGGTGENDFGGFGRGQMPNGEMNGEFKGGRGMGGQMLPEGQTPPEMPNGKFGGRMQDGKFGKQQFDGQQPPEMPDGQIFDGQMPPEMPDGKFGGGHMGGGHNPMMQTIDDGAGSDLQIDRNLYINGGIIRINAEGDGVDSNADIIMTGGELYVDGPTNGGNGAIDGNSFNVSGGTVIAVGSSGMAMGVSQDSDQCGILVNTNQIAAGTLIELKDGDETIMSYTPAKNISSIAYSSDKLKEGGEYTLYAGGEEIETISMTSAQVTIGGRGSFGGFGGRGMREQMGNQNPDKIRVTLNGRELTLDADPIIADDTTLIPLRNVLEELGLTVDWDETTQTVTAAKDDVDLSLRIGSTAAKANGKDVTLLTAPIISNDRTLVPIRFIAESLGLNVDWNGDTRTVIITE